MKPATTARRTLLATAIAGATVISTGCSSGGFSLASMNPFSQPSAHDAASPNATQAIASTVDGTKGQANSIGSSAKSAFNKTTDAVTGVFKRGNKPDESATDPLSLANRPEDAGAEVYVANGQLWESTGDYGKAMESYTRALESEANNAPALTSIARLHFRQGKHELAADFFQRAIAHNPNDAGLHNDLGLTLSKLGNHPQAVQSLEKALTIAPGTSRYANNLASVRYEAGDATSAFQVLAKNNKPAVAHFNMAYLHFKNGQMKEARGHLSEALQSEPQAAGDSAVRQAVERSRDMLAQIEASMSPVAQAAPQATIAGGQFFNGAPKASVQQTSQSGAPNAKNVAPAAPMTPAMAAIQPPKAEKAAAPQPLGSPADSAAGQAAESTAPAPTTWNKPKSETTTSGPKPVKPASSTSESSGPSIPFALPSGFNGQ